MIRRRVVHLAVILGLVGGSPLVGCSPLIGLDDGTLREDAASGGADSSPPDGETATTVESGGPGEGSVPPPLEDAADAGQSQVDAPSDDGPLVIEAGVATVYHDLTDPKYWSKFDLATVPGATGNFSGAAFDGKFVYFAPYPFGGVVRHDTTAALDVASSWSLHDVSAQFAGCAGFQGALFDGRYVHFVSYNNGEYFGRSPRFDSQAAFDAPGSWSVYNLQALNPSAYGFWGGTFDGRHVYYAPYFASIAVAYDTTADYALPASRAAFDISSVDPKAVGYQGAVSDGRYVYYVPSSNVTSAYHGVVARYDNQGTFAEKASWATYDVGLLNPGARGYAGAVYDGRYVYLVPFAGGTGSTAARYDTKAALNSSASWLFFDTTTVRAGAKGFYSGVFDGRYVYLVPLGPTGAYSSQVLRYDTQAEFNDAKSWQAFDVTAISAAAKGFGSVVFDGESLYFVPRVGSTLVRFDARTPPGKAPGNQGGSFF